MLQSLCIAIQLARETQDLDIVKLFLIDNSPPDFPSNSRLHALFAQARSSGIFQAVSVFSGHGNIGYGAAHNKALHTSSSDYHLVLNPDIELHEQALQRALSFMQKHRDAGLLAPAVYDHNDRQQYLCRAYPTVFDLLLRGFAPAFVKRWFQRRLARYELRDAIDNINNNTADSALWDVCLISGCFMLLRRNVVTGTQGFSPAFFLYFEDYDLSLRGASCARTVYLPGVIIHHFGGFAARKGLRHIFWFMRSAMKFFNRHGWAWFRSRAMSAKRQTG